MLVPAAQRVPLIEEMVTPVNVNKAVRIVQQTRYRSQMPARIVCIAERARLTAHHRLQDSGQ